MVAFSRPSAVSHLPVVRLGTIQQAVWQGGREDGGARRDRTADLLHAMQALSQLSYSPLMRRGGTLRNAPAPVNSRPEDSEPVYCRAVG